MLEAAVATVNAEPLPTSVEGKEQFFMEQVGIGEMLASKMPRGAMPAAIAFFKAYKVYPSPQELLVIYQRTMPLRSLQSSCNEMIKLDVNRVINSAKNSYRSPSHRGPPTGSGPSPSAPAKPTSDESKPSSSEESKQAVAEHPVESSEGESKPPSDEEETPKSISENPSLEPNTETSSAAHSENGSATGASQTANSLFCTSEETATPIEPEHTPSEEIVSEDQAQEDAPQEAEKELENESEEEPENESEEELVQEELEHTTVEAPVAEQTQE
ncbi:hypothetical protein H4Q26_000716 [Puccinia striiformis f. sp. tritici PST-130]|nr:hypothetical protein H4Q26_000716 [Puccinia striiformis f. sp. tritici PST-130]